MSTRTTLNHTKDKNQYQDKQQKNQKLKHDTIKKSTPKQITPPKKRKETILPTMSMLSTTILLFSSSILSTLYCHFSITLLCINVTFDLFVLGIPLLCVKSVVIWFLKIFCFYNEDRIECFFESVMNLLIQFTTPTVYGLPMVLSGSKVYMNDIDLFKRATQDNSLLLANHGSRIDWMLAMYTGSSLSSNSTTSSSSRVGFICEGPIQYMPIIGWYRKLLCNDIFVWRSFARDSKSIQSNLISTKTNRMLFLSPEGIVVDFKEKDMQYIEKCREFCQAQGYKPFRYVLTPRYKGTKVLLSHVHNTTTKAKKEVEQVRRNIISVCLAYVQDGKLLNCEFLSSSSRRSIPDIYMLNQGLFGRSGAVDIYVFLRELPLLSHDGNEYTPSNSQELNNMIDIKHTLMQDYTWKDEILYQVDQHLLSRNKKHISSLSSQTKKKKKMSKSQRSLSDTDDDDDKEEEDIITTSIDIAGHNLTRIQPNHKLILFSHLSHAILILLFAKYFFGISLLFRLIFQLFSIVCGCHTIGLLLNTTTNDDDDENNNINRRHHHSMESVPFETFLKSLFYFVNTKYHDYTYRRHTMKEKKQ